MKTNILFAIILIIIPACLIGQNETPSGTYKFTRAKLKDDTDQKEVNGRTTVSILSNASFNVIKYDPIKRLVYYQYHRWDGAKLKPKRLKYNEDENGNKKTFTIPYDEFVQITQKRYQKWKGVDVKAYTVPFRLRNPSRETFEFESSLSLQANLVAGVGTRNNPDSWLDFSLGLGLTSAPLDSLTTKGAVKGTRTASAFTISLGVVLSPVKNANIGIFLGWDSLGAKDRGVGWIYNNRPWYGLGINVSFQDNSTDKTAKYDTNK